MLQQIKNYTSPTIIISNGQIEASSSSFMAFRKQPMFIRIKEITKITIKNEVIDHTFWTNICDFFGQKHNHLAFYQCTFPKGFKQFYDIRHRNISIIKCDLNDEGLQDLFNYLNPYDLVGNLDLSQNQLGQDEQTISEVLSKNLPDLFAIKNINFTGNPMRRSFIEELQEEHNERTNIIFEEDS